ncbi:MAG: molybdopterin dinucleotide-binding protein [Methanoregulaceae archaeon]|nr:molybdopterin dinucleotide-binding protein [Methanoregulaceae archaeon]
MKVILNTGRTIRQGSYVERKTSAVYQEEACRLQMNRVDMLDLEIEEGAKVRVQSDAGAVVLKAYPAEGLERGRVFVCIGPYANFLISAETHCTGMPDFKTTMVDIKPTAETVLTVAQLMELAGGVPYEG